MNIEAAIAYWLFVCSPALVLVFAVWKMAEQRPLHPAPWEVGVAFLIGADFIFLLVGTLHQGMIGPAFSTRRYSTIISCMIASSALAVFAGRFKSPARNSLFVSACLLAGIWGWNLAVSSVV